MGKRILLLLIILCILTLIAIYTVNLYRNDKLEKEKINQEYKEYINKEIMGTELISLINKTADLNKRNKNNEENNKIEPIAIYVKFIYKKKEKTISMEDIIEKGSEAFVQAYSTQKFKCTSIEYHESTNNIKSLVFEEI